MEMIQAKARRRERRSRTLQTIDGLVAERREMLILFCQVAGLPPYSSQKSPNPATMQRFCQVLIDYVAAGHFGLYQRIVEGRERRQGMLRLAGELYPRIAETTQKALDFSDKYADLPSSRAITPDLTEDLSSLGEELALRVELEDKLIAELRPALEPLEACLTHE